MKEIIMKDNYVGSKVLESIILAMAILYEGEWNERMKHDGFGKYYFGKNSEIAGDRFEGEFKDGKANGFGKYYYSLVRGKSLQETDLKESIRTI